METKIKITKKEYNRLYDRLIQKRSIAQLNALYQFIWSFIAINVIFTIQILNELKTISILRVSTSTIEVIIPRSAVEASTTQVIIFIVEVIIMTVIIILAVIYGVYPYKKANSNLSKLDNLVNEGKSFKEISEIFLKDLPK